MEVRTPLYPAPYPNYKDEEWKIETEEGKQINFKFMDFDIEKHSQCRYDWVEVIDENGQQLLPRSCGTTKPSDFISVTNKATVRFHSDYSVRKRGFDLKLEYVDSTRAFGGKVQNCSTHVSLINKQELLCSKKRRMRTF